MTTSLGMQDLAGPVLRQASPVDFGGTPIYIVRAEPAVGRFLPINVCLHLECNNLAFTTLLLDQDLRPYLEERGRWQGRGFACVLDTDKFQDTPRTPQWTETAIGMVIHEATHWLQYQGGENPAKLGCAPGKFNRQHIEKVLRCPVWQAYYTKAPVSAVGHGAPFVRAAVHLWHRTNAVCPLPIARCWIAGANYGLSRPETYAASLGTELRSMANTRIADILRTRPPEAFAQLWKRDCQR